MVNHQKSSIYPKRVWVDADVFIRSITEKEADEYLYGSESVHAQYTERIKQINEALAKEENHPKAGRPKKKSTAETDNVAGMCM